MPNTIKLPSEISVVNIRNTWFMYSPAKEKYLINLEALFILYIINKAIQSDNPNKTETNKGIRVIFSATYPTMQLSINIIYITGVNRINCLFAFLSIFT